MVKHYLQWFTGTDWLGNKCKNIYFGPRLKWMRLINDKKREKKSKPIKRRMANKNL